MSNAEQRWCQHCEHNVYLDQGRHFCRAVMAYLSGIELQSSRDDGPVASLNDLAMNDDSDTGSASVTQEIGRVDPGATVIGSARTNRTGRAGLQVKQRIGRVDGGTVIGVDATNGETTAQVTQKIGTVEGGTIIGYQG